MSDVAQAIILGCTEITLLVDQRDASVPLFDTTSIHARSAAEWAVGKPGATSDIQTRPQR